MYLFAFILIFPCKSFYIILYSLFWRYIHKNYVDQLCDQLRFFIEKGTAIILLALLDDLIVIMLMFA